MYILTVYKESLRLIKIIHEIIPHIPKNNSFLGKEFLIPKSYDIINYISKINSSTNKTKQLEWYEFICAEIDFLEFMVTLMGERKEIAISKLGQIAIILVSMRKELHKWKDKNFNI